MSLYISNTVSACFVDHCCAAPTTPTEIDPDLLNETKLSTTFKWGVLLVRSSQYACVLFQGTGHPTYTHTHCTNIYVCFICNGV